MADEPNQLQPVFRRLAATELAELSLALQQQIPDMTALLDAVTPQIPDMEALANAASQMTAVPPDTLVLLPMPPAAVPSELYSEALREIAQLADANAFLALLAATLLRDKTEDWPPEDWTSFDHFDLFGKN